MKTLAIIGMMVLLAGCGYNSDECYQNAREHVENRGGTLHMIPGKRWTFLTEYEDGGVGIIETMNITNCDVTKDYKI